ncbi:natural killer cells antigen CD94-like [Thalassophryne amazonica]|uniref:natural killer cells antigen CD94-like n=1 Tax=Thalassophryne amazonica TaxID=390379 RepID=UPI0014716E43|nr:natural killer cells antigen CD94-like [Thalassophryne amazonica]
MEMEKMDKAKATREKAEPDVKPQPEGPSEAIYSEAVSRDAPPKAEPDKRSLFKQALENLCLFRAVCIFLSVICLVLLVVVLILALKSQTASTDQEAACSFEKCKVSLPKILQKYHKCQLCAEGWLTFEGWCFYLSTFRLNWEESQRNCRNKGGSLAVITNSRVQTFLTEEGIVKYWIGLRQNATSWNWVNVTALGESFWAERKSEGDCGILNTYEPPEKNWIKASCKAATYFICQRQL